MKLLMRLFQRNGGWYVEVRRGVKKSLKTKDAAKARAIAKAMEKAILAGRIAEIDHGPRETLADFSARFLDEHAKDLAAPSQAAYGLALRQLVDALGGSTLVSRIDRRALCRFRDLCLARGCSPVSVNTYLRHVRTAFSKAVSWGLIKARPEIPFARTPKRFPRILTRPEAGRILAVAKKKDPQLYRIAMFALWTGARRAEIIGLRHEMVNGTRARIIGKGDRERIIPLLPWALRAIGQKGKGPVFAQLHLHTITHRFKALAREAGIDDCHFHNLRHTAGTWMLAAGIGLEYVQKMLGHEAISTTQIYAQVLGDSLEIEMQKMLSPAPKMRPIGGKALKLLDGGHSS